MGGMSGGGRRDGGCIGYAVDDVGQDYVPPQCAARSFCAHEFAIAVSAVAVHCHLKPQEMH